MAKGQLAVIRFIKRPSIPGRPDQGLPGEPETPGQLPVFPDEDEGEIGQLPEIPVGIWPPKLPPLPPSVSLPIPPTIDHPIAPIPPGSEGPGQLPVLPPGTVWPPTDIPSRPELGSKKIAAAFIYLSGVGWKWRWVVIDEAVVPPIVLPPGAQPK